MRFWLDLRNKFGNFGSLILGTPLQRTFDCGERFLSETIGLQWGSVVLAYQIREMERGREKREKEGGERERTEKKRKRGRGKRERDGRKWGREERERGEERREGRERERERKGGRNGVKNDTVVTLLYQFYQKQTNVYSTGILYGILHLQIHFQMGLFTTTNNFGLCIDPFQYFSRFNFYKCKVSFT